ncbi:hypothetical protein DW766_07225 [Butyricicoccus sp. AM29-23AC]|nr:hypothetical protein DW766_07225 [Butyricicoccus sp. AM29-23AC]
MFHSRSLACKKPYGAAPAGKKVEFAAYPRREQGISHMTLWVEEDGQQAEAYPMRWFSLAGARDEYGASFTPPHAGLYWYWFTFDTADGPRFCARGYGGRCEVLDSMGDRFQLTVYDPSYQPPRWFGEGITYNIFPDRFCRDRDPVQPEGEGIAPRVLHENWDDLPVYRPDEHGEILNNDFFGGTLRGVLSKLDYFESLHVRTLYFNPIFQAYSNHRYDTGDYKRIDPLLGSEEDFKTLCEQAEKRGMRVVLDGVFNHTGYDSRYFNGRGAMTRSAHISPRTRRTAVVRIQRVAGQIRLVVGDLHPAAGQRAQPGLPELYLPRRGQRGAPVAAARRVRLAAGCCRRAARRFYRRTECRRKAGKTGRSRHRRGLGGCLQQDRLFRAPPLFRRRRAGQRDELSAARRHPRLSERRHGRAFCGDHGDAARKLSARCVL